MNYTRKLLFLDVKFSIVALKSLLSEKILQWTKLSGKVRTEKPIMLGLFYISGQSGFLNFPQKNSISDYFFINTYIYPMIYLNISFHWFPNAANSIINLLLFLY